jgi:hypothetical protein
MRSANRRSVLRATWSASALAGVAAAVLGASSQTIVDPVDAVAAAKGSRPSGKILRITRDYNNDGREDVAIGFEESCGQKTCAFELFLQADERRYTRVGELGGLPWGFRLVPLARGRARWETCTATGFGVDYITAVVSTGGITTSPPCTLSEEEGEDLPMA